MATNRQVVVRLTKFADALGWTGLCQFTHELHAPTRLVRWYEAGDTSGGRLHCALQINERPIGQTTEFCAALYGIRYRICSGWHDFHCQNIEQAITEARRLQPWLSRDWIASSERRHAYRQLHPQCAGYTWKKLRENGPPG